MTRTCLSRLERLLGPTCGSKTGSGNESIQLVLEIWIRSIYIYIHYITLLYTVNICKHNQIHKYTIIYLCTCSSRDMRKNLEYVFNCRGIGPSCTCQCLIARLLTCSGTTGGFASQWKLAVWCSISSSNSLDSDLWGTLWWASNAFCRKLKEFRCCEGWCQSKTSYTSTCVSKVRPFFGGVCASEDLRMILEASEWW